MDDVEELASNGATDSAGESPAGPRRPRGRLRLILGWVPAGAAVFILLWMGWEYLAWPDVDSVRARNPATTSYIELHRQRLREQGSKKSIEQRWVPFERISTDLKFAVVAAEDIDFFGHEGFAGAEIRAALREAIDEWEMPRGASTITQQLARNLWLSASRSPLRKLREAILTRQLENTLTKRRILELYLNLVEFGPEVYGVEAASRHYYGKPASAVGPAEAARLAAVLPRPRRWNPHSDSQAYHRQVRVILGRMEQAGWLRRILAPEDPAADSR